MAGMIGGAVGCVIWYVAGYMKYQTFDNWIGGIWPAILGPMVSLVLVVLVSKLTKPTPKDVIEVFF
jgi:Na+/proline symporter